MLQAVTLLFGSEENCSWYHIAQAPGAWGRIMTQINNAVWEMAQNKILQKGTNITHGETSVLIKYGCLSSLPCSDRWGRSAYFGFCCIFLNKGYSGSMKTGQCMPAPLASLPPEGQNCTHRQRIFPSHLNRTNSLQ